MFEEYLEDAHYFAEKAPEVSKEQDARRYYRVAVFCTISAVEAFINYIGDSLDLSDSFQPYEIAFLTDRKFDVSNGAFQIRDKKEYHRLEDKLKFLIYKFSPGFDFALTPSWSRLLEFKKFRDSIIHPREDEDIIDLAEYRRQIRQGLSSAIEIMDNLCLGIFKRHLRQKLLDLNL